MLQSIRDRAQGVMAWVILLLICIPFIFWGIENYIVGGREQPVAVVGDKEIFQADVSRAYQQMAAKLGNLGQIDEQTLKQLALKNLIDEEILRQTALERGFLVSDARIRDAIRAMPYFQNEKGFDKEKYGNILRAQGLTEPYFVERIRKGMEIGQLQDGITRSTFATKAEIERFLTLRDQFRTIEYITIAPIAPEAAINPDEIESYYREHEAAFRYPEQVSVQYVELNLDDIAVKLEAKEDELRAFYESEQDLYTRKERRKVSHILAMIDTKDGDKGEQAALEKIRKAQKLLADGEEFAKVAEQLSDDKASGKQGGNIGLINPGELDPEFEKAAFALELGRVSDPVKTTFGYHLIKLTELEAGEVKPFETVKAEVEKAYRRNKAENTFYELGERLAQISYESPDSLTPAAESAGLEIKTSDLFTSLEKDGFGANPKIAEAAFGEQVLGGKNSDPIEITSDRVMLLRLAKHVPESTKPLDEVRDQVAGQFGTQKAREAASQEAARLFVELKAGSSLAGLAESDHLKVEKSDALSRTDTKLPRELIKAAFSADKPVSGQSVPFQVALPDGRQVVAVLLAVQRKSGDNQEARGQELEMAEQWLSTQTANTEFSDLLGQLKEDSGITLFESKD
ncbi:MAG: SurA N-terminal domain-containing protein [Methylococcales bacterium]